MKTKVFRAENRGSADYGWLKAKYSFSFSNYHDSNNINFGALRVLNDDIIDAGMGFGEHPHDNMEIISIPLEGSLKHRDSMSNKWIELKTDEVQIMSAGTGLRHSEMNNSTTATINLFQIWIIPNKQGISPRYNQKVFLKKGRENKLQTLVCDVDENIEGALKIHQDARISRVDLEKEIEFIYEIKSDNHGVFIMLINGEISIENEVLSRRDAIGIIQSKKVKFKAISSSEILLIEVPMTF